jgi:hypothetical protein
MKQKKDYKTSTQGRQLPICKTRRPIYITYDNGIDPKKN